ncbi:hypothetical protein E2C01_021340 [Portunus trituberculatus]|uniref:Uncharacterized protein n=1 Tax=Portunus trituberculatus TaxID=210409 RepID=A0A5B7E448_PORTR|nr:hypothetical protein [Portunus trituberculatus]
MITLVTSLAWRYAGRDLSVRTCRDQGDPCPEGGGRDRGNSTAEGMARDDVESGRLMSNTIEKKKIGN